MRKFKFRFEFNPKDFWGIQHVLNTVVKTVTEQTGRIPDQWNFKVGRIENNAELHAFEGSIWVPEHLIHTIPTIDSSNTYIICGYGE